MIPDETGRYCNSCQKSVIDFTGKTDEEIQQFFINNFSQPVCARFKNTQVQRIIIDLPQNIFSIQMPLWKRFLVACLIIFGISIFPFETTVAGRHSIEISFYQDEPAAVKAYKKPRILKKKKRRKAREYLVFIEAGTLSGVVAPYPYPPITQAGPLDTPKTLKIYSKENLSTSESLPPKEQPGPTPLMPTEFILPAVLMYRRKKE